jgi:hypothetical protein
MRPGRNLNYHGLAVSYRSNLAPVDHDPVAASSVTPWPTGSNNSERSHRHDRTVMPGVLDPIGTSRMGEIGGQRAVAAMR